MKQLNKNTLGKNSWNRHWEKLYFLKNTWEKFLELPLSLANCIHGKRLHRIKDLLCLIFSKFFNLYTMHIITSVIYCQNRNHGTFCVLVFIPIWVLYFTLNTFFLKKKTTISPPPSLSRPPFLDFSIQIWGFKNKKRKYWALYIFQSNQVVRCGYNFIGNDEPPNSYHLKVL